jgi:hypothetical protein
LLDVKFELSADTLRSYYEVSLERFIDMVCREAIEYALLYGEGSPLKFFPYDFVMGLGDEIVDGFFGGDSELVRTKRQKELEEESKRWEAAADILA